MLETERLLLRPWREADRAPFAALNAAPETMRFFPATLSRAESDAGIDRCNAEIAARGFGFFAVETKHDGAFVGFVGLHAVEPELPFAPAIEIGWRLLRHAWGRGYATEAARASLALGFEVHGLAEIVSFTAIPNRPSRAVMERLGMRESGTFEHPGVPEGHPLRPHVLYRLARP